MAKRRRMSPAEAAIKKRLFADLILDTRTRRTKEEICDELGITEAIYYKWSKDPDMVEWAGIETWRYSEGAKHYVRAHQSVALRTLVDIMENSPNDMARVRAAETFLSSAEGVAETKQDSTTDDVVKLLTSRQPALFIGNVNFLQQPQLVERPQYEIVEAEVRMIPETIEQT
jgi:hypothetical protein